MPSINHAHRDSAPLSTRWTILPRVLAAALACLLLTACTPAPTLIHSSAARRIGPTRTRQLPTVRPEPVIPPGFTFLEPPPVVNNGPRTGNAVALTFDADMTTGMAAWLANDQSGSYANLAVIEMLEQRHTPATFFITGMWVEQYPDVMRRLAGNPDFEMGNHTWSHGAFTPDCYQLPQVPRAEMAEEIERTFAAIRPYQGNQTNYFRFPGLCHDAAALAAIAPTHVTVVDGDVVSGDPGATSAAPIVHAVLSRVKPGSIVVLHITEDNARYTDEALPQILDGLAEKGLQPVRLSTLLSGPAT